jgi:hypothetical protein
MPLTTAAIERPDLESAIFEAPNNLEPLDAFCVPHEEFCVEDTRNEVEDCLVILDVGSRMRR